MFTYLPLVYLFVGTLFLFWPGSGNLASAVDGRRSAKTGKRNKEHSGGKGKCIGAFGTTVIVVPP